MKESRRIARDYIAPRISPDMRVLDVCCGDEWVYNEFRMLVYWGLDARTGTDLTVDGWEQRFIEKGRRPDLILSIYGLIELRTEEARIWTLLRRIAKPETKFVVTGNYASPAMVSTWREKPINFHDERSIAGLGVASGWKVEDFKVFQYVGEYPQETRVYCATLGVDA